MYLNSPPKSLRISTLFTLFCYFARQKARFKSFRLHTMVSDVALAISSNGSMTIVRKLLPLVVRLYEAIC